MKTSNIILASVITISLFVSACTKETKTEEQVTPTPTLYQRVGGTVMVSDPNKPGEMIETGRLTLRAVVDSSILVIAGDSRLAKYFPVLFAELGVGNTSGLMALSKNFTDFLCLATGCKNTAYAYTGKSMKDAHNPSMHMRMGAKANAADFDAFVGDIGIGLAKNGVTATNNKQLVDDLVALLYTTKSDIVQE
jgi:outer membrane murein-binding lipoprotein Lpp